MDRNAWMDDLDKDLATRGTDHSRLWTYGLSLLVAGASLSVFVARTFDASGGPTLGPDEVVMAVVFSCLAYVLVGERLVGRVLRTHPPVRRGDAHEDALARRVPLSYRLTEPKAAACWVLVLATYLLLAGPGGEWTAWSSYLGPVLFGGTAVWLHVRDASWVSGDVRSAVDNVVLVLLARLLAALALIAVVTVALVAVVTGFSRLEAALALLGLACVPALLLCGAHLLRHVAFDRSLERMEQLRLDALRHGWDAARIGQAFFDLERTREQGPVFE